MSKPPVAAADRLNGRARFVYRIGAVNYFRCLGCGHLAAASHIRRHCDACFEKPGAERSDPDAERSARLPYRDD